VFGQLTIWVMLGILAVLTLGFAALAVRLGVQPGSRDTTLLAETARASTGGGAMFAAFQAASALLLLAAAASSYLAGSGLLRALALAGDSERGLVPRRFGRANALYAPTWGLGLLLAVATALVLAGGGRDQVLIKFYAVAVFASFLGATAAAAALAWRERRRTDLVVSASGAGIVAFVLALNMRRPDALVALVAAAAVSGYLWRSWVARGRPVGIAGVGAR